MNLIEHEEILIYFLLSCGFIWICDVTMVMTTSASTVFFLLLQIFTILTTVSTNETFPLSGQFHISCLNFLNSYK